MKRAGLTLVSLIGFHCITFSQNVKIGTQIWMTTNLDVSTFRNGDPIQQAKTDIEWEKAGAEGKPVWCYYNNDPTNAKKYGKLYNWHAVNDPRGLAPAGYHIPSLAEWTGLIDSLGGPDVAGKQMKSTSGWADNGNGTNKSGFSGLPGGWCSFDRSFKDIDSIGFWWSSSESDRSDAWGFLLPYEGDWIEGGPFDKTVGFSVRCVRD